MKYGGKVSTKLFVEANKARMAQAQDSMQAALLPLQPRNNANPTPPTYLLVHIIRRDRLSIC
jgi:hypothetical protein